MPTSAGREFGSEGTILCGSHKKLMFYGVFENSAFSLRFCVFLEKTQGWVEISLVHRGARGPLTYLPAYLHTFVFTYVVQWKLKYRVSTSTGALACIRFSQGFRRCELIQTRGAASC